jgi:hypothetical protein
MPQPFSATFKVANNVSIPYNQRGPGTKGIYDYLERIFWPRYVFDSDGHQ